MITQAKRMKLRDQFKGEEGINWMNSQDEPDIDYVEWLEGNLLELSHNSDYVAVLREAFKAGRISVMDSEDFTPAWQRCLERLSSALPNCT